MDVVTEWPVESPGATLFRAALCLHSNMHSAMGTVFPLEQLHLSVNATPHSPHPHRKNNSLPRLTSVGLHEYTLRLAFIKLRGLVLNGLDVNLCRKWNDDIEKTIWLVAMEPPGLL